MIPPAKIKSARLAAGLTQTEAAALVHKANRTWQAWEYGRRNMPEADFELFMIKTKEMQK